MLRIQNLTANVGDKQILKGLNVRSTIGATEVKCQSSLRVVGKPTASNCSMAEIFSAGSQSVAAACGVASNSSR